MGRGGRQSVHKHPFERHFEAWHLGHEVGEIEGHAVAAVVGAGHFHTIERLAAVHQADTYPRVAARHELSE